MLMVENARKWTLVILSVAISLSTAAQLTGQPRLQYSGGGLQHMLPDVPVMEPRPSEGGDLNQRWRTQRVGDDGLPVAGFLDSVKGNDAAIEVIIGQGRLLTTKQPIAREDGIAVIAVGDPSVVDFEVLPDPRMIRLLGTRVGVTDLMVLTSDGETYGFEVHVVYDLDLLRAHLAQVFPDALIRLGQIREHMVVEGQARSNMQIQQITRTIELFLTSSQVLGKMSGSAARPSTPGGAARGGASQAPPGTEGEPAAEGEQAGEEGTQPPPAEEEPLPGVALEEGSRPSVSATTFSPQIINLMRVPSVRQVMLKVQIAELNRTSLRQIGTDMIAQIGNNTVASFVQNVASGGVELASGGTGTLIGIFDSGNFNIVLRALRQNNVATILAEPNLVTLDGHVAHFQSGGEFPVPVAQMGGGAGNNSVEFKPFGVQLAFVPYIQDDGVIRLHVEPEVSTVDEDLSVALIETGAPVPGVRTRNASTTVELREGQTLAIAGLLDREVDGNTARIPILGDLPYLGPFFGSTRHQTIEQELLVLVTPYLVGPSDHGQCLPLPGMEIMEPNDLEFYLMNRIEGRTGRPHRSTTQWDNPFRPSDYCTQMGLEQSYMLGPIGLTD